MPRQQEYALEAAPWQTIGGRLAGPLSLKLIITKVVVNPPASFYMNLRPQAAVRRNYRNTKVLATDHPP
jgi:hypothetical protein